MSGIAIATLMILAGATMIVVALVMRAGRRKPSPLIDPAVVVEATQAQPSPVQSTLPLDPPAPAADTQAPPAS